MMHDARNNACSPCRDISENFFSGTMPVFQTVAAIMYSANCQLEWEILAGFSSCSDVAMTCDEAPQRPLANCIPLRPLAPSNVGVSAPSNGADASVVVTWTPPLLTHSRYAPILNYTVTVAGGGETVSACVPASDTKALVEGLDDNVLYSISVAASNEMGPGASSLPVTAVKDVNNAAVFTFSYATAAIIVGSLVAAYTAALVANRACPGDIQGHERDFTGLFALLAAIYYVGTDVLFARYLLSIGTSLSNMLVFFGALGCSVLYSGRQVYGFTRTALALRAPPPPHTVPFAAWVARNRTWYGAVLALSSLQMTALEVINCRAFGRVGGALSAPVDRRIWRGIIFHATAMSFLRNAAVLLVVTDVGGLLQPAVFLKLVSAAAGCLLALSTMALDAMLRRHPHVERGFGGAELSTSLLNLSAAAGSGSINGPEPGSREDARDAAAFLDDLTSAAARLRRDWETGKLALAHRPGREQLRALLESWN
jgi:hypothetical protein